MTALCELHNDGGTTEESRLGSDHLCDAAGCCLLLEATRILVA
jgi:hypothetical protein